MGESTVSFMTSLVLQKIWYAVVGKRERDELKGVKAIIRALLGGEDAVYKAAGRQAKLEELLEDSFSSRIEGKLVDEVKAWVTMSLKDAEKQVKSLDEVKAWVTSLKDADKHVEKLDEVKAWVESTLKDAEKHVKNLDEVKALVTRLEDAEKQVKSLDEIKARVTSLEDAKKHVKNLDEIKAWVTSTLKDAKKHIENLDEIKGWVTNFEDALYEADDFMDLVYNKVAEPVKTYSRELDSLGCKVGGKIEKIRKQLPAAKIARCSERQGVVAKEMEPIKGVHSAEIQWLGDSKAAIEERFWKHKSTTAGEEGVTVVAIVGNGGLGKTKLARFLFHLKAEHFDLRIWLNNVHHDFNARSLVEGVILYAEKQDAKQRRYERARNREQHRIFEALVEGIIVSTARDPASQSQVKSARKRVIERFSHETCGDDENIQRWSGFETEIIGALEEHFQHLDEDRFQQEISTRVTVYGEYVNQCLQLLMGHKNEAETSTTKDQLRHLSEGAIQIETDEEIFKSLVVGIIVYTAEDSTSQSAVVSAKQIVVGRFMALSTNDDHGNSQRLKGYKTEIMEAIRTHFHYLDKDRFRAEMSARQKEHLKQLSQTSEQVSEHSKDDEGLDSSEEEISAIEDSLPRLGEGELHEKLRKLLDGKRLLLVLDDVWDMDSQMWLNYRNMLSSANVVGGSKLIITSRCKHVGKIAASTVNDVVHFLPHPDERASCKLFQGTAFPYGTPPVDSQTVEIAVELVKRCGGNPFALTTVAKKLKNSVKPENGAAWSNFRHREFHKMLNEEILPSLKRSYDALPLHLKHCFAYCSIFPRQFIIDVKELINLWMAQGFIYPSPGQRMEDAGYECVAELCQRCLFEEVEVDPENGSITKCKMPSLIHDLAVLVSGTRLHIATTPAEEDKVNIGINHGRAQHVTFHFHLGSLWEVPPFFQEKRPRVRTIILPSQLQDRTEERESSSTWEKIISSCTMLRTLDLHSTGIKSVPESISKLKYLSYLDLSQNSAIKLLPDSITKISYLMTLKLSSCYGLLELPKDMKNLVHLKHLEIDWCYRLTHMPPGLGQLTQLEILSEFILKRSCRKGKVQPQTLSKCFHRKGSDQLEALKELAKLNNLRGHLKIKNLRNVGDEHSDVKVVEGKEHLKSLTLCWEPDDETSNSKAQDTLKGLKPNSNLKELALYCYRGDELSGWIPSLISLVKFSLQKCMCKNLEPLTQLTSLKVLILEDMPNLKHISNKSSPEFMEKLEELRLTEMPDLEGWCEEGDASSVFPRLSNLMIEDCPKLHSMPLYPNLKDWLVLKNTRSVTFMKTMQDGSSSTPLSNLQSLFISGTKDIGLEFEWKSLTSLRFLRLENFSELKALPEAIKHVHTLQELEIWHCTTLESLPEGINELKQLNRLQLSACPSLKSLPKIIKDIKLETLEILDCPILLKSCQKVTGIHWNDIKHIENILLQQQPQDHIKLSEDEAKDALNNKEGLYKYYWDPKHGKKSAAIKRTVLN